MQAGTIWKLNSSKKKNNQHMSNKITAEKFHNLSQKTEIVLLL